MSQPDQAPATTEAVETVEASKGKTAIVLLIIAVLGLVFGYIVLTIIETLLDIIWLDYGASATGPALWILVLVVPTAAGALVALLRQHGADGHNPMSGIAINPITTRDYPSIIGAIALTLIGGLALGPEVAMVSTGAWLGTTIANRTGIKEKPGFSIGALFAILALFVGPLMHGTFETAPRYQFALSNVIGAVIVGLVTAVLLLVGRFISLGFLKMHGGDRPKVIVLAGAGLTAGVLALIYYYATNNPVGLVLTSGESNVKDMLALGTVAAIGITIIFKLLIYSISMGGGFRGGPYFPAIYIGAGAGAMATIIDPTFGAGASAAGIAAACVYLAHPNWVAVVIIGVVIGFIAGGPQLIVIAVVGALVAKAIPSIKVDTQPTGEETITEVR